MQFSKKLKIVLQSNYILYVIILITTIYVLIFTILIKYNSNITSNEYIGTIYDINIEDKKITFYLKGKEKLIGYYYVNENNDFDYYSFLGNKVKIIGSFDDISNNTIPNTFNYKRYLYNNKIYKICNIKTIEVINNKNIFYKIKYAIINRINSFDEKIKTYLNIFILGDKSFLDSDIYDMYRVNGIWFLFAISGMHINLLVVFFDKIFKRLHFKRIIISFILLFFTFLTSFSSSVIRAILFYYLKSIFNHLNIQINNIKTLFFTAFIMIILNPFIIYNTGFQYSFIITFAILLIQKEMPQFYFKKLLKISSISFVASLPITISINYEINLLNVILNIIFIPLVSFIIFPLTILCFFFRFLHPVLILFIDFFEFVNNILYSIQINIIIPKMSFIFVLIYYLFIILYLKCKHRLFLIVILFLIIINIFLPKVDKSMYIFYLDVGQGDSSIIISPNQKEVTMVDTGGLVNSKRKVTDNGILFLKSLGISKINNLILTHGDYDHMGEAINLVENFKVEKVIFNCGPYNDLEKELIKVLDKKKIKYYSCIEELNIYNNKLYFLQTKEYDNENDNSNVIYTELNGYKFMFMGDAGVEKEKDILDKYNINDVDVLKVGHHGSKTSSDKEFINEINPKYSIISVGKSNRYGHPNKEVLNNLNNSKIYRTDQDGSIMFKIKNNKLKIETCSP